MSITIINYGTTEQMDMYLIPNAIYNETINKEKIKIQEYFIKHPKVLYSFVGFNGQLKLANQLASNKKCGCFYKMPWVTYYDVKFSKKNTILTFAQQVDEYRYMILNWYPSPRMSYMQYLSQIALGMILEINQYMYYITNNLSDCSIFNKEWYKNNFANERMFKMFAFTHFSYNNNNVSI
jgi:hypothetical protein